MLNELNASKTLVNDYSNREKELNEEMNKLQTSFENSKKNFLSIESDLKKLNEKLISENKQLNIEYNVKKNRLNIIFS